MKWKQSVILQGIKELLLFNLYCFPSQGASYREPTFFQVWDKNQTWDMLTILGYVYREKWEIKLESNLKELNQISEKVIFQACAWRNSAQLGIIICLKL